MFCSSLSLSSLFLVHMEVCTISFGITNRIIGMAYIDPIITTNMHHINESMAQY